MAVVNFIVPVTTDTGGAATAYTQGAVSGEIEHIRYIPDGSSPLDTNAVATITAEVSTQPILTWTAIGTSAATKTPRTPTHDASGAAALYAAAGTGVLAKVNIAGERIKIVIASGGNTLKGSFNIVVSQNT